jgi:hypothetical protein
MSNEIYVLHDAWGNPVMSAGKTRSVVKSYTTTHGANIARTNMGGKGHMKIAVYKPAGYVTEINGKKEECLNEEDFNRS